ncbi:MAG: UPF0182 family protein [Syntrophothermaceae bacterium]
MESKKTGSYIFWGTLLGVLILASVLAHLYIDYLWFGSLNFSSVFTTTLLTKILVAVVGVVVAFAIIWGNLVIARRYMIREPDPEINDEGRKIIYLDDYELPWDKFLRSKSAWWLLLAASLLMALLLGASGGDRWIIVQQFLHAVPFGSADPIFGKDISFYIFKLRFYQMVYGFLMASLIMAALGAAIIYLMKASFQLFAIEWREFNWPKKHLSVLLAAILLLKAWGYRLAAYSILYSPDGVVYGAGYADIHARLLGYKVLLVVALLVGVVVIANIFIEKMSWVAAGLGVWLLTSILLTGVYPVFLQKFVVEPNEFAREQPYIKHSIKFTREAYGLDKVENKVFDIKYDLTAQDIEDNEDTIRNIRLWDWQPLKTTYKEIQEIRPYYSFNDIDIDRYVIDGKYRQVMLSPRELVQKDLPEQGKTWLNQRLKYTHGHGIAMSPVNEVATEGLPHLFIRDIPPRFTTDLKIDRPEIYYGEKTDEVVFVNTRTEEFDYPSGDENVWTRYEGESGVRINSLGRKLALAWVFRDYKMLLSNDITNDSYVLFNRNIHERTEKIAPFLKFEQDPYVVISDGKIFWIQDAYTCSSMYPYSAPFDSRGNNYIRNSVKIVVDAYSGETTFYLADTKDPVVQSFGSIFPRLFKPMEEMPKGLFEHVRYPEDMFLIQSEMFTIYHMQDPQVFYNKEDKWNIPNELIDNKQASMSPYYIIMRLPGESEPEYIQMLPFTPNRKQNMIAWLCARSDGENYGKLLVYNFPKQELIFGPMQVESRINQDSNIAQQLTLWDQKGSRTFKGNLMVIPINQSILYVEPLYLQAEQSQIPELRRVIMVYGDRVVMEETLEQGLAKLFAPGKKPEAQAPAQEIDETETPETDSTIAELIAEARKHYDKAQAAIKDGDWAGYGASIKQLESVIGRMEAESRK